MAGYDLAPFARLKPTAKLLVEGFQFGDQPLGGAGITQRCCHLLYQFGVAHRVEPDVRIEHGLAPFRTLHERLIRQEVDGICVSLRGLFERRHEPFTEVQDRVSVLHMLDVAG